jgi:hypothetical protein
MKILISLLVVVGVLLVGVFTDIFPPMTEFSAFVLALGAFVMFLSQRPTPKSDVPIDKPKRRS